MLSNYLFSYSLPLTHTLYHSISPIDHFLSPIILYLYLYILYLYHYITLSLSIITPTHTHTFCILSPLYPQIGDKQSTFNNIDAKLSPPFYYPQPLSPHPICIILCIYLTYLYPYTSCENNHKNICSY